MGKIIKTIEEMEKWIAKYIHNEATRNKYLHGYCLDFSEDMVTKIGNRGDYEQWELWYLEDRYHKKLPLVVTGNAKLPGLCDIGDFWHVVIKWEGYYWDAGGKHNTLEEIMPHYDQCPNPHWLQTA